MRFLFLTQYFLPEIGAPQIRLAAIARALKRRGHVVEVVTALPHHLTGRIYAEYEHRFYMDDMVEGNAVHRTWAYAATGAGPRRLLNYASFTLSSLLGLARSRRPDYIFVESPPLFLGIPGAVFSWLRRTQMIFNVADLWPDSVRALGVLRNDFLLWVAERLEAWIYNRSNFINATTAGIKHDLLNKKKLAPSKVLFLPNGVDTKLFAPREPDQALRQELQIPGQQVFLYAGTHGVAQGLETILDAAALLQGEDIIFLFVGNGPTKPNLIRKKAAESLDNVLFAGIQPVEAMPRYFSIATASIVPLVKNELFKGARPSKIFSSLAAGIPVIYCGAGESAELLTSRNAGIVVDPQDPAALAAAILRLSKDEQLQRQLATAGRTLAEEQFDWDAIVGRWLDHLTASGADAAASVRNSKGT